jgi:zinc and cadmium transporter
MLILWIIVFSILGSLGAIIVASIFLLYKGNFQDFLIKGLIAYATGTLLAAALLGLLPNALKYTPSFHILFTVLVGILLFFVLEKLVIWRHCHNKECDIHGRTGSMILIGDAFHNFTDGIIIAASFLVAIPIGIATALSVIAHEIPQEVGDFGLLLHSGYSKRNALVFNTLSGLTTLPAAIITYYALDIIHEALPYVMAISASSFLYIALADLFPELHHRAGISYAVRQLILILLGVSTILIILNLNP